MYGTVDRPASYFPIIFIAHLFVFRCHLPFFFAAQALGIFRFHLNIYKAIVSLINTVCFGWWCVASCKEKENNLEYKKTNQNIEMPLALAALIFRMLQYILVFAFFSPLPQFQTILKLMYFSAELGVLFSFIIFSPTILFIQSIDSYCLILTAGVLQWLDLTWLDSTWLPFFLLSVSLFVGSFSIIFFFSFFLFRILNELNCILLVAVGQTVYGM